MTVPQAPAYINAAENSFTIAGRKFRVAENTSARQDMHILALVERAGLPDLVQAGVKWSPEAGMALMTKAYRAGVLFELLGATVVEEGQKWSPEAAHEVAEFFGNLTEPQDKEAIQVVLLAALTGFFVNDDAGTGTSPNSSAEPPASVESSS